MLFIFFSFSCNSALFTLFHMRCVAPFGTICTILIRNFFKKISKNTSQKDHQNEPRKSFSRASFFLQGFQSIKASQKLAVAGISLCKQHWKYFHWTNFVAALDMLSCRSNHQLLLKISQYSRRNTCVVVSF